MPGVRVTSLRPNKSDGFDTKPSDLLIIVNFIMMCYNSFYVLEFDGGISVIIKLYEEKYRDDLIFMVLQAKDALGRKPTINKDLLDIRKNYFDSGDMFWVAINEDDRVIGCIGYSKTGNPSEAFLHRLYVKVSEKHKGIGTKLLQTAENEMRSQGITVSLVHLGSPKKQWFESYSFYPKNGYREYASRYMRKDL